MMQIVGERTDIGIFVRGTLLEMYIRDTMSPSNMLLRPQLEELLGIIQEALFMREPPIIISNGKRMDIALNDALKGHEIKLRILLEACEGVTRFRVIKPDVAPYQVDCPRPIK